MISENIRIRTVDEADAFYFIPKINEWWGGRKISHLLQTYHFNCFQGTSFTAEQHGRPVGFLIGFPIQSHSMNFKEKEAYIHFVGVDPAVRKSGIGRLLYEAFFKVMKEKGCDSVKCVTSPVNESSINFHQSMGFQITESEHYESGWPVHSNAHENFHIHFTKRLSSLS